MKKLLKISVLSSLFFVTTFALKAQKFGHLNSGNLLVQMPETKGADAKLKVFQDSLIAIGEEKAKKLEQEFNAFVLAYREGNIPPAAAQKKQAEFQQKEAELADLEEEIMGQVAAKREELIAPIIEKVQAAINEIGKEAGYTMIFDTSIFNTILFAQDSDDIEPLVKAKLGLN
jgi:outer membrane protein